MPPRRERRRERPPATDNEKALEVTGVALGALILYLLSRRGCA